ncbi:hypothetical protein [Oribacterium sp. P6A1]|uniref:hypothetical protein n=1 Tax=Oribacterium sp. P6A1 TaxID=1410612 RepID=UPI00056B8E88|nr:hypothetical protein [Oribacterium sp. P6A1]
MANIALLVPNDELFRLAHDALQEMKKRLFMMKVIETESAVTEARQAINQGADIIIASFMIHGTNIVWKFRITWGKCHGKQIFIVKNLLPCGIFNLINRMMGGSYET